MVHRVTRGILFVMNASLIVPILAMIRGERHYNWGLIPAIAIASYTFYRIVMAIVRYAKTRKEEHSLMKQLGTFRLIDSLVALLTLQNTMIIVQEGAIAGEMQTFSIRSSILIWLVIVGVSVRSFRCP
jgi:L-asparagine transporter-like permease